MLPEGFTDSAHARAFFAQAPVGIAYVGLDGVFLAVNDKLVELTGFAHSELEGKTFQQITHPEDVQGDTAEVQRMLSNPDQGGYSMIKRYIGKTGQSVWLHLHVRPIIEAGMVKYFISWLLPLPNHGRFAVKQDSQTGQIYVRPSQTIIEVVLDTARKNPLQLLALLIIVALLTGKNVMEILRAVLGL